MCIFLYVQAMMWEEINGNGTDQNGGLDIWLSDISDTSVRRPAVASSVNCQFHLSEVLNITVSWGSAMQLSRWCSQGAPPSLLQPPDVARSALRVSKLTLNSEKKSEEKWTRFWLAWYTLGKHNRWVQLANILCSLEGLAVPAPELHINTLMRSWPRSNITEANQLSIWGESIVVPEKTSFSNKEKFSIWGEYGKWVKSVPNQRWWLRSLCWTGWLMFRGVQKKNKPERWDAEIIPKWIFWWSKDTEALQNLSRVVNDFLHTMHTMRWTHTIADEWECSRAVGAVMMMMMMMHKSQIYRQRFFSTLWRGAKCKEHH